MNFYVLLPYGSEKFGGGLFGMDFAYAEQIDPVYIGDYPPECPVCKKPVGLLPWLPPHRVKLSTSNPKKWGDFLWGPDIAPLVSDHFKVAYEQEELRGITRFYPPAGIVRLGRRKPNEITGPLPSYRLIDIVWGGAAVDLEASGIRTEEPATCDFCRYGHLFLGQERTVLEEGSWTGEDIFMPRGGSNILVSERFRQVIERYHLRNALLVPLEQYYYVYPGGWRIRPGGTLLSY